jgi:hypothetical protein
VSGSVAFGSGLSLGYGTTLHYVAVGQLKRAYDEISAAVTAPPVEPYPA